MWWERFPFYGAISDKERLKRLHIRINHSSTGDPGWGPMAQCGEELAALSKTNELIEMGIHPCTWEETFGSCFIYAMAFDRKEDGSFYTTELTKEQVKRIFGNDAKNDTFYYAKGKFNGWGWENGVRQGAPECVRWMGIHNTVNSEDIVGNTFLPENFGFDLPTYPDGSSAVGWTDTECYPLNAKLYDACCSKDIYGVIDRFAESYDLPESCNRKDEKTGQTIASPFGLYHHTVTENDRIYLPTRKVGERLHVAIFGVGKDPAAPFWKGYVKNAGKIHARMGMQALWCDNMSPFNNFGFIPMQNGFGDWSVARFRDFIKKHFTEKELEDLGIDDVSKFDVRKYLIDKARQMGAKDANRMLDFIWKDGRWLEDDVWSAYKIHKAEMGREGIKNFYDSLKEGAREAGCDEFCIMGNDIPWSLGWIRDDSVDMASVEVSPGWCYLGGEHGFGAPPYGKLAPHYRACLEHQSGPYANFWYYNAGPADGSRKNNARVILAEAFSNHAFFRHGGGCMENDEVAAPWNSFLVENEEKYLGRKNYYDFGIWYSGSNQLQQVPPGHFTLTPDAQPHTFGYLGFVNAMIDAHIPYRILPDWKVTEENLSKFKTFIIPNAESIDDEMLPIFRKFVENGGRLVITGSSGTRYGQKNLFRRREKSLLREFVTGREIPANYYDTAKKGKIQIFVTGLLDIQTLDNGVKEEVLKEAENDLKIYETKVGKGTAAYIQAPVDMEYFLKDEEREKMRPLILRLLGESDIFKVKKMKTTASMTLWKTDGSVMTDIYNVDINENDVITPTGSNEFSVMLPEGKKIRSFEVISPEKVTAEVTQNGRYAEVRTDSIEVYASVKIELE